MTGSTTHVPRRGGRGIRPWLIAAKLVGISFFVGGLATMSVISLAVPHPGTLDGWSVLRTVVRTAVLRGVLPGALLTILAGVGLFLLHRGVFLRSRWFRIKVAIVVVATPALHLWARGRVTAFDRALTEGRLADVPGLWSDVALAFAVTTAIYLAVVVLGRTKPRLGQRPGARRKTGRS